MITSLLDNDLYQFSMSACLWDHGLAELPVRYEFRNRTFSVPLASRLSLDWLRFRIEDIRDLRFTDDEVQYLTDMKLFPEGWLKWLPEARLPEVTVGQKNGHLTMVYEGPVGSAIFWETMLLALVNEHYFSRFGDYLGEGTKRLDEKIEYLRERKTLHFVEFGTRRRYSKNWQHYVLHQCKEQIPELLAGTSNVALAKELELPAIGTMAHQMFMIFAALGIGRLKLNTSMSVRQATHGGIEDGTNDVLRMWAETYGEKYGMMTVLPDTYGTQNFVNLADPERVRPFNRWRQDSGDPMEIGDILRRYDRYNLERNGHSSIVFSDSLDVRSMSVVDDHFAKSIASGNVLPSHSSFGWGTNLTNDLGYEPLSIVIKPCAVQFYDGESWLPCVKISDDKRKATGDPKAIDEYLTALSY